MAGWEGGIIYNNNMYRYVVEEEPNKALFGVGVGKDLLLGRTEHICTIDQIFEADMV